MTDTRIFDLYGFQSANLLDVSARLAQTLHLVFQKRTSDSWGEYVVARRSDGLEVYYLKTNYNPIEDEYNWPNYQSFPLILEAVLPTLERAKAVETQIALIFAQQAQRLRHKSYSATNKKIDFSDKK